MQILKKRIDTICRIAKINRKAGVLFSGSQFSAFTWGHQVVVLAQTQIDSLKKRGALSTRIHEAGRCRTWALFVGFGRRGHPMARILKELFGEWFQTLKLYCGDSDQFIMASKAWDQARKIWYLFITKAYLRATV